MSAPNTFDPVAIAIEICNKDAFKIEVFSGIFAQQDTPENCKKSWDEKVEIITGSLLKDYPNLQANEQETVIGAVLTIAFKMLTWIEFHIETFGFTRDFCIEFLDSALFTREGIIDSRGVETKMSEKQLTNLQRFQLASFYCQWKAIPGLFNNLSKEDRNLVYNENEPELVKQKDIIKFWSYHTIGELYKFKDDKVDQLRLKCAIRSGSQLAVNYCLEKAKSKQSCLTDTAVNIFRYRVHREINSDKLMNDWIVYRNKKYNCAEESWVPDNFLADIFYSVIPRMSQSQKLDFWRHVYSVKFILSDKRINHLVYFKVFQCFLCWPYQEMFLEFWKLSWPRLSVSVLSSLLLHIVKRIEPERGHFWFGEEKLYDYRKLLMDIWTACPKSIKTHLFRYDVDNILELCKSLYNLKTFTDRDRKNIKSIIESATEDTRFPYMTSVIGFKVATMLLESKRLDLFNELISTCFVTPADARDFKIRVILFKAKDACLEFVKNRKWNEAEEILKWSEYELNNEDMLAMKKLLIISIDGTKTCIALWKTDPELADQFVRWCLPSEEEALSLKKKIISSEIGQKECRELCITSTETADNFVRWCLPPEKHEIFKDLLIRRVESISMCTKYVLKDNTPELAEKLISWCLPQEKIKEYKKNVGYHIEVQNSLRFNFKLTFNGIENCTYDEFPDKIFDWEPAKKMFSWCFALNHEGEKTMASNFEEKATSSDPEEKPIASDSEAEKTQVPNPESEKTQASEADGERVIASEAEGERVIASEADRENMIASELEGKKKRVLDKKEETNIAIDLKEVKIFKRMFLIKSRSEIIYKCLESNNWNVADKFISWLNLDKIDLKTVKTEQLYSGTKTGKLLYDLLSREENDPRFAGTGGKQRTIERFIHWFLVDDVSIVKVFIMILNRYSDDSIVQSIITKLKQSDDIEAVKELLTTH